MKDYLLRKTCRTCAAVLTGDYGLVPDRCRACVAEEELRTAQREIEKLIADAAQEVESLRAFAREMFCLSDWPEGGDIDGFEFQEAAIKHRLLVPEERHEPCNENSDELCQCADSNGPEDWKRGVKCYRKVQWLMETPK